MRKYGRTIEALLADKGCDLGWCHIGSSGRRKKCSLDQWLATISSLNHPGVPGLAEDSHSSSTLWSRCVYLRLPALLGSLSARTAENSPHWSPLACPMLELLGLSWSFFTLLCLENSLSAWDGRHWMNGEEWNGVSFHSILPFFNLRFGFEPHLVVFRTYL